MHRLQAVLQHGAIDFTQHILSDFYDVIRPYAEDAAEQQGSESSFGLGHPLAA